MPGQPKGQERQRRGTLAEARAEELLRTHGFQILLRNFRCRGGELDIVARHGALLVIVEVRLRTHRSFGGAAASIGAAKRRRLWRAARYLLHRRPALAGLSIRFDAVLARTVDGPLEWLQGVF